MTVLQKSIKVWREKASILRDNVGKEIERRGFGIYVGGKQIKMGQSGCPLCKKYYKSGECTQCPVAQKTGSNCCYSTPYWNTWYVLRDAKVVDAVLVGAFKAEVMFLELLEEAT